MLLFCTEAEPLFGTINHFKMTRFCEYICTDGLEDLHEENESVATAQIRDGRPLLYSKRGSFMKAVSNIIVLIYVGGIAEFVDFLDGCKLPQI